MSPKREQAMKIEKVLWLKKNFPAGTKVMLDYMDSDPDPIAPGSVGIVQYVDDIGTLHCKFNDGRELGICPEVDMFHRVV